MSKTRRDVQPWRDEGTLRWAYYEKGLTVSGVANLCGSSYPAVHKWMERHGIERRDLTEYDRDRLSDAETPWRDSDLLEELLVENKLSTAEVAERLDCSASTVRKWASKHNIGFKTAEPWKNKSRLQELYVEKELSTIEVGEKLDCSGGTVLYWLKKLNIPVRPHSCETTTEKLRDGDLLYELYHERGLSTNDLSERFDTTNVTILRWLRKHGIETRGVVSGHDHPQWKPTPDVSCASCGSQIDMRPARADKYERHFCNHSCFGEWRSKNVTGETHPNFDPNKSRESRYYGPNYEEMRLKAIIRDQARCVDCGCTEPEHIDKVGRSLSVHHVRPLAWFKKEHEDPEWFKKGNGLSNLVTLCVDGCHQKWERMSPLRPETSEKHAN